MKRELRSKSVGTKVTEAELRVLESRAERAGLTLSEWVRRVAHPMFFRTQPVHTCGGAPSFASFQRRVGEHRPQPAIGFAISPSE